MPDPYTKSLRAKYTHKQLVQMTRAVTDAGSYLRKARPPLTSAKRGPATLEALIDQVDQFAAALREARDA